MKPHWVKIQDDHVRHVWKKQDDDDCDEQKKDAEVSVSPDFYEENGTPLCACGDDLQYSHTEILLEEGKHDLQTATRRL